MRITVCCCRRYIGESIKVLLERELRKQHPAIHVCADPRRLARERCDLLIIDYLLLTVLPAEILDKVGGKALLLGTNCASLMERRHLALLLSMGLLGIVPANASGATLRRCVLAAAAGRLLFTSEQVRSILSAAAPVSAGEGDGAAVTLTAREFEIVRLLCRGFRNKEITSHLGLSEQAVKSHISRIGRKLGVTDRLQIVLHSLRHWPHLREESAETPAAAADSAAGATSVAPTRNFPGFPPQLLRRCAGCAPRNTFSLERRSSRGAGADARRPRPTRRDAT
jgi:two-component system response regulator NreC